MYDLPANEPEQFNTDANEWDKYKGMKTPEYPPTVSDDPEFIDFTQY